MVEHDMITVLMQLIDTLGENGNVRVRINNDDSSYSCLTAQLTPKRKALSCDIAVPMGTIFANLHYNTEKISLCNPVLHSEKF